MEEEVGQFGHPLPATSNGAVFKQSLYLGTRTNAYERINNWFSVLTFLQDLRPILRLVLPADHHLVAFIYIIHHYLLCPSHQQGWKFLRHQQYCNNLFRHVWYSKQPRSKQLTTNTNRHVLTRSIASTQALTRRHVLLCSTGAFVWVQGDCWGFSCTLEERARVRGRNNHKWVHAAHAGHPAWLVTADRWSVYSRPGGSDSINGTHVSPTIHGSTDHAQTTEEIINIVY